MDESYQNESTQGKNQIFSLLPLKRRSQKLQICVTTLNVGKSVHFVLVGQHTERNKCTVYIMVQVEYRVWKHKTNPHILIKDVAIICTAAVLIEQIKWGI
jgi:hypothetical protein